MKSRAKRIAEREAAAAREVEVDKFVRSKMKPELVAAAKKAIHAFNTKERAGVIHVLSVTKK